MPPMNVNLIVRNMSIDNVRNSIFNRIQNNNNLTRHSYIHKFTNRTHTHSTIDINNNIFISFTLKHFSYYL